MEKRLGIDMGTNSLGWALVEMTEEGCVLLDRGVDIFQEGVIIAQFKCTESKIQMYKN